MRVLWFLGDVYAVHAIFQNNFKVIQVLPLQSVTEAVNHGAFSILTVCSSLFGIFLQYQMRSKMSFVYVCFLAAL